jgi:hypothetical protein
MNMPIISGSFVSGSVDTSYTNRISGFLANSDNLCGQYSFRRPINFGQNTSSACSIKVDSKSFNCSCLKSILFNRLNSYYAPSQYVSRVGHISDFNPTNSNWLRVLRDNQTEPLAPCDNSTGVLVCSNDTSSECHNIPTGISVWFMYAEIGKSDGQPIYQSDGQPILQSVYVR